MIGQGWIGAEVAASIRQLGRDVTYVIAASVPLERVLGPEVGAIYRDVHAGHGVRFVANQRVVAFHGSNGTVEAVETADGTRIDADLVVVGIGATPRTALAEAAGLAVEDGVLVNARLETSVPGIFAAGDIANAVHPPLGRRLRVAHWDNARRQGARRLGTCSATTSRTSACRTSTPTSSSSSMEYAGYPSTWDRVVFRGDVAGRTFIAFWLSEGRVIAGMNVNVHKVNAAISKLVASGAIVDVDRLTDSDVPLESLVPAG